MASANTIKHSYLLALDANISKDDRDAVVQSLEGNGAKIENIIDYPDIMQAISFSDTKAANGQVNIESDDVRINSWKTSLDSFGDKIVSLEQDQIVSIPEPIPASD